MNKTAVPLTGAVICTALGSARVASADPSGHSPSDPVIVSPEDILADHANTGVLDGVEVRKGTVGAWVANVKKLESMRPGDPGYDALATYVREESVKVRAVGVFDILTPRSPQLADIVDGL